MEILYLISVHNLVKAIDHIYINMVLEFLQKLNVHNEIR